MARPRSNRSNNLNIMYISLPTDDVLTYLEAARVALADEDVFDWLADRLDISDDEMIRLQEQLNEYLGPDPTAGLLPVQQTFR